MVDQASSESIKPPAEQLRIDKLLRKYEKSLGPLHAIPIGNLGYIIERRQKLPLAGSDWIFYDYDDTLVATTEVKQKRLEMYKDLLNKKNISLSDDQILRIMKETDDFSRWEDQPNHGMIYHANAHMTALSWLTGQLAENNTENINLEDLISEKIEILLRIKNQLTSHVEYQINDPFEFRNGKLVLHEKTPWSKEIEKIFFETMINPPIFSETVDSARELGKPEESIHRPNLGILSYGDLYYQLLKICELLEKNPDIPISQFWITRVRKGDFIKEVVSSRAVNQVEMKYVPQDLEDYPGESMAYGSGYPLGKHPHLLILFDDSIKEAQSIEEVNDFLGKNSGAEFITVRSVRAGTKEEKKLKTITTRYGQVDFRDGAYTGSTLSSIIDAARYLARKKKFGENDKSTQILKQRLVRSGFDENSL